MLLLARLSFIANSPLNAVFTFTLPCLSIVSRTCSRITLPTSSKNRRGSMWRLEFITYQYSLSIYDFRMLSISRHRSPYPCIHMHESSTHRILQTLEPHNICDYWLSLVDWQSRTFGMTVFFQRFYELVASFPSYSMVFSWVACSIKSRSVLSLALTNDAMRLNLLILYHLFGSTLPHDICITLMISPL